MLLPVGVAGGFCVVWWCREGDAGVVGSNCCPTSTLGCCCSLLPDCRGVDTGVKIRVNMAAERARFGCMHTGGVKGGIEVLGHVHTQHA